MRRALVYLSIGMITGLGMNSWNSLADTLNRLIRLSPGDSITLSSSDVTSPTEVRCGNVEDSSPCLEFVSVRAQLTSVNEMIQAVRACQGNYGDACLRLTADRANAYSQDNVQQLAVACRGDQNEQCVSYVLNRAGTTDLAGVTQAAEACQGNLDAACVRSLSELGGAFTLSALIQNAKNCAGQ